jgi:HK97 family phage prohead protease
VDEGLSVTGRRMVGYALHWGEPAFIGTGHQAFEERFIKGAFAASIAAGGVLLCSDHDRTAIVARQDNGTLTLVEDAVGLRVDAWAMGTPAGDDAIHDARCRYRAGLSVAFDRALVEWQETAVGRLRLIKQCRLVELSVIKDPAYRSSELFAGRMRIDAFEARLRLAGDHREQQLVERDAALAVWS